MRDPRRLTAGYKRAIEGYFESAGPVRSGGPLGEFDRLVWLSIGTLRRRVRSPLEALLGVRLVEALARRNAVGWDPRADERKPDQSCLHGIRLVTFCCNFRVDRHSFDFWVQSQNESSAGLFTRTTVVECDGRAWHWGRQIERDRRKDELTYELDWTLFRIDSGTILAGPVRCAEEIVEYVLDGTFCVPGLTMTAEEFRIHCSEV